MFGGRIDWAYGPMVGWGALGAALLVGRIRQDERVRIRLLPLLIPGGFICVLAFASVFNPSFEEFTFYEQQSLRPIPHHELLPSSARPSQTLKNLLLYSTLYLSAFNIMALKLRRTIRFILFFFLTNGAMLAVFGTLQKLIGSDIFFGLEESPNPAFFATFVYHNHWGAFALLSAAIGIGLTAYQYHHLGRHGVRHSPIPVLVILVSLLLLTIPLSSSRSATLLAVVMVGLCFVIGARAIYRQTQQDSYGRAWKLSLLCGLFLVVGGAAYRIAEPVIQQRFQDTVQQIEKRDHYALIESQKVFYLESRFALYRDTWAMFSEKPVFGWGLGSYGFVFMRFDTQSTNASRWPTVYLDAHSDWLELLAELGIVGLIAVIGVLLLPLTRVNSRFLWRDNQGFLLIGCSLILVYAMVEFPFVSPAVMLVFFLSLFSAYRIAQLDHANHSSR